MVHQEFMLIPEFDVTENIKLGREIGEPTAFSKVFGTLLENELDTNVRGRPKSPGQHRDVEH